LAEAIAQASTRAPSLVIVDINLPDGNGLEFIAWFRKISEDTPIVVLSFNESAEIQRAVATSGANAFVSKSAPLVELMTAIRAVLGARKTFISFGLHSLLHQSELKSTLSVREVSVLSQLAIGGSIQEIAGRMHISPATLKTHISHIYRKLEVNDRTHALNKGRSLGII
jgi:DNA-binding NarL/FixJ family response regulator